MSFPWIFEANGETGSFPGEWSGGATDTQSKSATHHFIYLAKNELAPYNGAYSWGIDFSIGSNADCYVRETTKFVTTLASTWAAAFAFYAKDLVMTASDRFTIFRLGATGSADEAVVDIWNNAGTIEIVGAKTGATTPAQYTPLIQKKWHWIELYGTLATGGAGTITLAVDGYVVGTQITGLTQLALTDGSVGAMGLDSGTTSGKIFFGPVIYDDTQIGLFYPRYARFRSQTKSGHIFIGPGTIATADLQAPNTDCVATFYDTDKAYSTSVAYQNGVLSASNPHISGPLVFNRGCFVNLSGTNPFLTVQIARGNEGLHHPMTETMCISDGLVKNYALQRKWRQGNT